MSNEIVLSLIRQQVQTPDLPNCNGNLIYSILRNMNNASTEIWYTACRVGDVDAFNWLLTYHSRSPQTLRNCLKVMKGKKSRSHSTIRKYLRTFCQKKLFAKKLDQKADF